MRSRWRRQRNECGMANSECGMENCLRQSDFYSAFRIPNSALSMRDGLADKTPRVMKSKVDLYDTTLRDGAQAEDVNFSVEDKIRIARKLDQFGVHYIEGGWPGSNPRDVEFFGEMRRVKLKRAKLAAFGATRRAKLRVSDDPSIKSLVASGAPVATIFGKTWDLHVHKALRTTLEENLAMISDSVAYLKKRLDEVVYDAEHFYDGYKANPEYATLTLLAAENA